MRNELLFNLAGLALLALPFLCVGAAIGARISPSCPVVEVTGTASPIDWLEAQDDAAQQARDAGCATIKTVRG